MILIQVHPGRLCISVVLTVFLPIIAFIDGTDYDWRDGDDLIFDETYLHYPHNDAKQYRLILMCDVEWPIQLVGRVINFFYKGLMRLMVVPNMKGDRRACRLARLGCFRASALTAENDHHSRQRYNRPGAGGHKGR